MSDVGKFWSLTRDMERYETQENEAKKALVHIYDALVAICPHPEAVDWQTTTRQGVFRRCKVCGIVDRASEGGTPGDEYDYGCPGHPSRSFWANTVVENVTEKEWWTYTKSHDWVVLNGKATKR